MRYILINWKSSDEFHLRHLQIHLCNICVFVCCIMNFFHSPHIKRSICIWIFCRFRLSVRVILWSQVFLFLSTKAEWKWPAAKKLWSHTHTHTFCPVFFFLSCFLPCWTCGSFQQHPAANLDSQRNTEWKRQFSSSLYIFELLRWDDLAKVVYIL